MNGSNYYGWQRQNDFITVQQKVEEAISALMKKPVAVRGASRTDTGVHAMCQGVVFETETTIPVEKMPYAINSFFAQRYSGKWCKGSWRGLPPTV